MEPRSTRTAGFGGHGLPAVELIVGPRRLLKRLLAKKPTDRVRSAPKLREHLAELPED